MGKADRADSRAAGASANAGDERSGGGSFPIVGLGASAGGLEAFTELLASLPADTGMAFVLVQHLDPQHESALAELLRRATSLPVREVTHNLRVAANHVYVIPPNTNLSIARGVLKLRPRPQARIPHHPIDLFLESLARDQHERAIGVILSGTATDGTLGLEAIKAEGGITFAQDDSARYDSMPRSAVAAGCVDFVLSPEEIARELARIAQHPYVGNAAIESSPAEGERVGGKRAGDGLQKILLLLRNHSGVDFSLYKPSTVQRRIARRMMLNRRTTPESYAQLLRSHAGELDALYSDTLISVTSFFRNPEAFDVLQRKVLPKLLKQRGDEPLRCWVLGCSSGQEAYSLAIAFLEAAEKAPRPRKLQVFATDLNDALLTKARHGLYAKNIAQDVKPERLRRFFVEEEGGYRIVKPVREMVVFARQNLVTDPPFSRMDLISCRNLLIYLEPSLQRKVLPAFHYALKPDGFLYLGASESIGGFTELFQAVDKKHKIYSKKAGPTPFHLPARRVRGVRPSPGRSRSAGTSLRMGVGAREEEGFRAELDAQREADRVTMHRFAPPGVLINAELQILQFRGATRAYLEPPTGRASFDVLKMARKGLMLPLRAAIGKAKKENKTARKENVRVEHDSDTRTVNLEVIPLKNLRERCFLIVFEDAKAAGRAAPANPPARRGRGALEQPPARVRRSPRDGTARRIAELEAELAETRDFQQSMQQQQEAANEELQASNEEVQSANEELQSITEELETSKEELESTNEELTTINEEMAGRNTELSRLNDDLVNVQTSAHLAIVLLGRDLTIRRFSAQAERQFCLLAADVGRPFASVRHNLDLPDLVPFITEVIDTVRPLERELQDEAGRWFSLRVRPYLTLDNKVDGAVLVLVDIDHLKQSEQAIAEARDYAEAVVRTTHEPLLVLNADLSVHTANEAFYATFHASPAESEGRLIYDLGNHQWDIPALRRLLEEILPRDVSFSGFEVTHDFERIGRRTMLLNARRMHDPERKTERILLAIEDVTERKRAEEVQQELTEQLATELAAMQRLQEASTLLIQAGEIDAVHDQILDAAIALMRSDMASMQVLDDDQDALRILAWRGSDPVFAQTFEWVRPDMNTSCSVARRRGDRVVVPDVETCDFIVGTSALEDHRKTGIRAVQSTPLVSRSGRLLGMLSTHWHEPHDPPERDLRLLDVLARQAADLLERTQADHALKEADRRKNEFLAMLAHELRNPLAPIRNALQALWLTPGQGETAQSAFGMMERQVNHMARLVDDLLDVSRISRGKIELRKERVELASAVYHAVEAARPHCDGMGHELTVALPPQPVYLNADPARLAQVVGNLLSNACKFTQRDGHIRLTVEVAHSGGNSPGEAVIRVRDDGVGIAADQLPRIFDMFMQVDTSLERSGGGLGIGLTLVKDLVERHTGTVEAYSAGVGQGSEFVVRLPIPVEAPEPTPERSVRPPPATTRRILIVDDNRDAAESMAMLLGLTGHETHTAHDGLEALEAATTIRPDVVLLDIGLPRLNGYEVAHKIREQPWGKKMGLVAMTGWGQEEDRRRSREAGFDAHMVKPVDNAALSKLLADLFAADER